MCTQTFTMSSLFHTIYDAVEYYLIHVYIILIAYQMSSTLTHPPLT